MTSYGYVYARRGLPASTQWAGGQDVEGYELLAPLPETAEPSLQQVQYSRVPLDAHGRAIRDAPAVREDLKAGRARVVHRHTCTCPASPSLVTELVAPDGTRWALITRPEIIPPAFRRDEDHETGPSAWPLHREPNGHPHIAFARCRRCGSVFVVALTDTLVSLIPTRPVYGARVTP